MRIALINFQHSGILTGGVETRYRLLSLALEAAGHECVLVSTRTDPVETTIERTNRCDLAISDSAICFETRCPMITIFGNPWHTVLRLTPTVGFRNLIKREAQWHAKHPTHRVAVSGFMAQTEMAQSGIVADRVIPNPADIERFVTPYGTGGANKTDPPTILWIGPQFPIKNYSQVAMLFDRWPSECADIPVRWKLALRESKDELNYDAMTEAVAKSTVVLCTSVAEGCSNTLMEAIAANVPIVTPKTGLFWDWWDDRFGVRVDDSNDTEGFMRGLRAVLQNPFGYSPREVATEQQLDFDHWAKRWQALVMEYAT